MAEPENRACTIPAFYRESNEATHTQPTSLVSRVPELVKKLAEIGPLSQYVQCRRLLESLLTYGSNMINQVVINFAANVALAG